MLFWITLITFTVLLILSICCDCFFDSLGGFLGTVLSGLVLFVMLLCMIFAYTPVESQIEQIREKKEALMFRLEHEEIRDEFGFINNELISSIRIWNEEVRKGKKLQHNFWIGVFVPNIYDEFECIDYNEIFNEGELKND